jgi:two-component system, chemotaxis family, sensor kinase Cph1
MRIFAQAPLPDVSQCDREPIHIPGSIQPHGLMLVVDADSFIIRYVAGPVEGQLRQPCLDQPLAEVLGDRIAESARGTAGPILRSSFVGAVEIPDGQTFDVTLSFSEGYLIFELEPRNHSVPGAPVDIVTPLESALVAFDQANSLAQLCEVAAREFRALTSYDRVMVYRFVDDGVGVVQAEDRRPELGSFLNHHFPASDIPQQARALYIRNLVRVIPDSRYVPVILRPDWQGAVPLDMSDSILRSVSPVHLRYLQNMGVVASASISILRDGALWGLIACHNLTPRTISYEVRAACRALASSLGRQIKAKKETEAYRHRLRLRAANDELMRQLTLHSSLVDEIPHHLPELCRLLDGDGFAMVRGDEVVLSGSCPAEDEVRKLAEWLLEKSVETIFSTDRLTQLYPAAEQFQSLGAGALALLISVKEAWLLIWFRAEQVQVVEWAGNPHKAVDIEPGEMLSPRASFGAWRETVHGRSRRWRFVEIEAAGRLRNDLIELRQYRRLKDLNRQLIETVGEKDLLLDQKKFLVGEISHRVQNSLQLVSSFLSLQARESTDPAFQDAVDEARKRIGAVSLLHRSLYQGEEIGVTDAGRYLADLCENLVGSMGEAWRQHFHLNLAPVMLPIDRVIPLGLIVTELIININKYAYAGAAGSIEITLSEDRTGIRTIVADRGRGRISTRPGFGTRMMGALVAQLAGELSFEDGAPGVRVILSAPKAARDSNLAAR